MNSLVFRISWRLALYPTLAYAVISFIFFWLYVHPARNIGSSRPEEFGLEPEALKLKTSDGVELDAWFIPNKTSKKAVIICHGYPMDKSDVLGLTSYLAEGFSLLYFDFRATGRSGGFFSTGGAKEVLDIDAAVKALEERGFKSGVGIFGFSMGAATALLSKNPSIKARVLDSPYADLGAELDYTFSSWGIWRKPLLFMMKAWSLTVIGVNINSVSPAKNTAAFAAPMLLVHGDADEQIPYASSAAIKAANPAAELWLVKGAGHGENRYRAGDEYKKRLTAFFSKNL